MVLITYKTSDQYIHKEFGVEVEWIEDYIAQNRVNERIEAQWEIRILNS